jgi:hypothetical protein
MKPKTRPDPTATTAPWNLLGSAGQQQAAAVTACGTALFEGFEEMRKVQARTAQDCAERQAAIAEKLKRPGGAGEVLALQAELVGWGIEGAARYWQEIGAAALEMQTRMLGSMGQLVDSEAVLEAAAAFDRMTGREASEGRS